MSHCLEIHPGLQINNRAGRFRWNLARKVQKMIKMMQQRAAETACVLLPVSPEWLPHRPLPADGSHHVLQTDLEQLHGAGIPVSASATRGATDLCVKKPRAQRVSR